MDTSAYRLINWCPGCRSALSDLEVDHEETDSFLWHVRYPLLGADGEDTGESITIATTRPETIEPLFTGDDVLRFHEVVRRVPIAEEVAAYAVRLAGASRPGQQGSPEFINEWVSWGAGLRAAQTLVLGAKARDRYPDEQNPKRTPERQGYSMGKVIAQRAFSDAAQRSGNWEAITC